MKTLIERVRMLEKDHSPDGWPSIQMRDVSNLASTIEALQAEVERLKAFSNLGVAMYEMTTTVHAPTIEFLEQLQLVPSLWLMCMEERDALREELATLKGAEPVAWMDDFGNAFPLGANKGAGSWMDAHKRTWKPLYAGAAPQAPAPLTDEACDRSYLNGLRAGYGYGLMEDHKAYLKSASNYKLAIEKAHEITGEA
jgi:hypothetical protein